MIIIEKKKVNNKSTRRVNINEKQKQIKRLYGLHKKLINEILSKREKLLYLKYIYDITKKEMFHILEGGKK